MYKAILSLIMVFCGMNTFAAEHHSDSLETSERRNKQNVLLNASSDSQPRVISLGIPQWGYPIMEDGLPTSMFSDFFPGFWTWRSGAAIESMELSRLDESAIQLGNTGFYPLSISKVTADRIEGSVSYSLNHHGRNQIEANFASPLGNGWGLNLNVYQDLNRGPNHLDLAYLQEHIQSYRAAVSKAFADNRGLFYATYQYTHKLNVSDTYGPFIFVGDGSVRQYEDFVLGRDQYLPATPSFDYIDIVTGEKESRRFVEDGGIRAHIITLKTRYRFYNEMELEIGSRARLSGCDLTESMLGSIEAATEGSPYTYENGMPYVGNVQTRYMLYHDDICNEWFTTASLKGNHKRSKWAIGTNLWFNWTDNHIMTINYAHEAAKNPKHLTYNGDMFYVHNTGGQFVEGSQSKIALFGQSQWNLSSSFTLRAGLRLEYSGIQGTAAHNLDDQVNNTRAENWSLQSSGVTRTNFNIHNFNGAASLVALYRFNSNWRVELDAVVTQQHAELWQYGEASLPANFPKRNYLLRGGPNFKNRWVDIQSLLMFYQQDNNYYSALWTHELSEAAGGYPAGYKESLYIGSLYSMRVLGWTTDLILTPFKGFSFHGMFTLRSARYIDYKFQPTFSDGHSELYDFTGKNITGIPAVEIELEPSYSIDRWKIWASARYYSKQYVNITNSLHFNPRWETFAGIDFTLNKNISFSLNVVNFLNEKGASAGIQAASLSSDTTAFADYLTSGTFLRPFTIEFSTNLRF